jgi:hypothetical protein
MRDHARLPKTRFYHHANPSCFDLCNHKMPIKIGSGVGKTDEGERVRGPTKSCLMEAVDGNKLQVTRFS